MMPVLSLCRVALPAAFYPTDDLRHASIPTDVVNLIIGLPILLGALARRGVLLGLLFWSGMLFFVIYYAIAFAAGVPFSGQFYLYVVLAALSTDTLLRLLASMDAPVV